MHTYLAGSHLFLLALDNEPEPIAGDGADQEGRHEDGEVLAGFQKLADESSVAAQRPVALQNVPQGQRGGENAEEEVGAGQSHDKRVSGMKVELRIPHLPAQFFLYYRWLNWELC